MAARLGHISEMYSDGRCRVVNELTGETWYGLLTIFSGGMVVFATTDERGQTVSSGKVQESVEEEKDSQSAASDARTKVVVGNK